MEQVSEETQWWTEQQEIDGLDILSVKKEAKLSATDVSDVEVGMMQICDRVTYLLFATTGVVGNRIDKIRVILFFFDVSIRLW